MREITPYLYADGVIQSRGVNDVAGKGKGRNFSRTIFEYLKELNTSEQF